MEIVDRALRIARELLATIEEADRRVDAAIHDLRRAEGDDARVMREDRRALRRERDAAAELEGRGGRGWAIGREGEWRADWPEERRWLWWQGQQDWAWREAHDIQRLVGELQRPGRMPDEWRVMHENLYNRFGRFRSHLEVMRRQWEPWAYGELDGMYRIADGWYQRWPDWRERLEGRAEMIQRTQHEMAEINRMADVLRRRLQERRVRPYGTYSDRGRTVQYRY